MSNVAKVNEKPTAKALFSRVDVKKRFEDLLGKKSQGFITSVLQIVGDNKMLAKADPMTVFTSAATAAALDLPINKNLGYAWIVPYKGDAQFQMGWRGYVQLAQRTGQYKQINVVTVYENQFKSFNALTEEIDADFSQPGEGEVVGYVSFFKLLNGYEKLTYWTKGEVEKHAKQYSQSYGKGFSPWSSNFDAMAKKTVLKNMLQKWGIMSIEMQTATLADSSVQKNEGDYKYTDNETSIEIEEIDAEKERQRIIDHIEESTTEEQLNKVAGLVDQYSLHDEFDNRLLTINKAA